jgi:hypothetical protein
VRFDWQVSLFLAQTAPRTRNRVNDFLIAPEPCAGIRA